MYARAVLVTLAAAALLTPALAAAQRGGRGGGSYGKKFDASSSDDANRAMSGRDFEKRSVVRVLLDNKKKLSLSDEQTAKFEAAASELTTQHAPIYTRVDSLQKVMRAVGNGSGASEDEKQHAMGARVAMSDVMDQMRSADEHATGVLMALLTDEQKEKATKVLEDAREETRGAPRGGGRRP